MPKRPVKKQAKTPTETPKRLLVPRPDGRGALMTGGTNAGGPGRPPSEIRRRLRGSFEERVPVLEDFADGRFAIKLVQRCEFCGKEPTKPAPTIKDVLEQAVSPSDRLKAIDLMAKYGLGAIRELTTEHVKERLVKQIAIIRESLPADVAEPLLNKLSEVWT